MSEVMTSLDMNFVNNGGGHTANITSVLNSTSVSGESELGTLNGSLGERYSFSTPAIQNLMKQFIAIEETISEDSNNIKQKQTKFQDIVSLKLNSHVVLVRGESASPYPAPNFPKYEGPIYDYSEHPFSPVPYIPTQGVKKQGGVFIMGETYVQKTDKYRYEMYRYAYKNKIPISFLNYNESVARSDPSFNELAEYSVVYGYTTADVRQALNQIGIDGSAIPDAGKLFNTSGQLSSVISSVANALGYYWTINPFNGKIEFINSLEAIQRVVEDPHLLSASQKVNIQNISYTKSKLKKVIVNSFIGDFENEENTNESNDRNRKTNFYFVPPKKFIKSDLEVDIATMYGLKASGNWNPFVYDAFFYYNLFVSPFFLKNAPFMTFENNPADTKRYKFSETAYLTEENKEKLKNSTKAFGNREKAFYFNVLRQQDPAEPPEDGATYIAENRKMIKPSSQKLFKALEVFFDLMAKSLYISRTFPETVAKKMQFSNQHLNVYGPYDKTKKLTEIEELKFLAVLFDYLEAGGDTTLQDLLPDNRPITKSHDYVFIGFLQLPEPTINVAEKANESLNFSEYLNESNVEMYWNPPAIQTAYVGYKQEIEKKIIQAISRSAALFKETIKIYTDPRPPEEQEEDGKLGDDVIQESYTKAKREVDPENVEESENGQQISSTGEDVSYNFTSKYYNILFGDCDGNLLKPATVDISSASIEEIRILEQEAARVNSLPKEPLTSASKTYYGLALPTSEEYDITLDSLSIKLNEGQGVTTTITESNKDLIPEEDDIVIGRYNKGVRQRSTSPRYNARQRNFFGL